MADVIFFTPASGQEYRYASVGTLLLATILKNNGIGVKILPLLEEEDPADLDAYLDSVVQRLVTESPKIVSFYTRCDIYHIALKLAQKIKAALPSYVVFGGPQSDIVAQETLKAFSCVDYVCQGEGETTIYPFFHSLLRGAPDHSVPGLVYRQDHQILQNPRPAYLHDLDALPEVDYSLIGMTGKQTYSGSFPVDVGRGCPFSCTYCSTKTFWGRKYRLKSPQRIYREVRTLREQFGFSHFSFEHDMFTLDRAQILETCRLLKSLVPAIGWACSARLDCLDPELIDRMTESGMDRIFIGIETGSPRMQKCIRKNLKLDKVDDTITYLVSKGVHVVASFIHGFPEETAEDLSQTISLIGRILKHKHTTVQTHLCAFLPGTELSQKYNEALSTSIVPSSTTGSVALAECEEMIRSHPDVFIQFRDYQSALRSQLQYYRIFIGVWATLQPVYACLAEDYEGRLFDMYRDFVDANKETLEKTETLPTHQQITAILKNDAFAHSHAPEDLQEIIRDCCRMACAAQSEDLVKTGLSVEKYCFSPQQFLPGTSIREYVKAPCFVTYTKTPDGKVQMKIFQSRGKL